MTSQANLEPTPFRTVGARQKVEGQWKSGKDSKGPDSGGWRSLDAVLTPEESTRRYEQVKCLICHDENNYTTQQTFLAHSNSLLPKVSEEWINAPYPRKRKNPAYSRVDRVRAGICAISGQVSWLSEKDIRKVSSPKWDSKSLLVLQVGGWSRG